MAADVVEGAHLAVQSNQAERALEELGRDRLSLDGLGQRHRLPEAGQALVEGGDGLLARRHAIRSAPT